jgi:hydrogenase nickel incorporation protein HypA/HybF
MSIVAGILDIAESQAHAAGVRVINAIEIEIGQLAGVEIASLEFCFAAARRGTLAANASLVIHNISGRGRCPECGRESPADFFVAVCPACGLGVLEISQGRELKIRSLNVD